MTAVATITLTPQQELIMQGKICPYCKRKSKYVDSSAVYGRSYGMIYLCEPCDAYCGVHKGSDVALGRLANKQLRHLKKQAHFYFDKIWQQKHLTRNDAYAWLSKMLNIPVKYTHIGMFSEKTCEDAIYFSKQALNDISDLDRHLGAEPENPIFTQKK